MKDLKSGVNFERQRIQHEKDNNQKIKWFDSLDIWEKQRLFNNYKGRKHHICFIKECNKIEIFNNLHNEKSIN